MDKGECDLCDRPFGEDKGQCPGEGTRSCKISQGKDQLKRIRASFAREAAKELKKK